MNRLLNRTLGTQRWWVTRILVLPLHLLVFAVVTFFLVRAIPGDPVLAVTDGDITPEQYEAVKESLGLNGSIPEQLARHIGNVATFDLGDAMVSGRPVLEEFGSRLPSTLELVFLALLSVGIFSLIASALIVFRPKNPVSRVLFVYARTAGAVPEFVWGVAAIFLFYATLHWAPAPLGRVAGRMRMPETVTGFPLLDALIEGNTRAAVSMIEHLVLPIAVLTIAQSALLTKVLVSGLQEATSAAPTRFRIASGAPRRAVVTSMYRRAAPPAVTIVGQMTGNLVGGAVIIEALFGLGGMGQYAVDAINSKDIVAIQGFLIVISVLTLLVFLLIDVATMALDCRRRPGAAGVAL